MTTKNTARHRTHNPAQLALSLTTPILSASQRDARPSREDRLEAARAVLARGLAGVRDDPAALEAHLRFRAHFRDYSARNTMLIWMQRPTARYCMGFKTWKTHGRRVKKGERGLVVLAPVLRRPTDAEIASGHDPTDRVPIGFRTATTFDYEQTEPVTDDALEYVPPTPRLDVEGPDGLVSALEAAAAKLGCKVQTTHLGYADGWYREADHTIAVRAGLSGADRASVLCHELAHAIAHTGDRATSRASKELQAEGAAFVVMAALGLDTARASLPYLRSWTGGNDEALADELEVVDRIADEILAAVVGCRRQGGQCPGLESSASARAARHGAGTLTNDSGGPRREPNAPR